MAKEVEDTILNDGNQMVLLYEKIDKLNIIIKKKEEIIKTYEDTFNNLNSKLNLLYKENEELRNELNKNNSFLPKIVTAYKLDKHMDLDIKENENKKEINIEDKTNSKKVIIPMFKPAHKMLEEENNTNTSPTPIIFSDNNGIKNKEIFRVTVNKLILIIRIKKLLYNNIKSNINKIQSPPAHTEQQIESKKIQRHRNKSLPIFERFSVKVYNDEDFKNSDILQFVGSEECFLIEYQYKIADKINKKLDDISIDDVIDFKIKYEGFRNTRTRRTEFKHLITRCKDLFEKYDKKLCKFKISLYYLKIMSDEEWIEWFNEFDILFNKIINNEKICNYKYKNGKECNKINCKTKHKSNIWLSDEDEIFEDYDSGYDENDDNINVEVEEQLDGKDLICIDCNYEVIHNKYTESIKNKFNIIICNDCMMYKIRNKIKFNKKLIKCKFKLFDFHKCNNEGTVLYNNKNICKYHYDYYILICNNDLIINSDEKFEDGEESDTEYNYREVIKEPDKNIIYKNYLLKYIEQDLYEIEFNGIIYKTNLKFLKNKIDYKLLNE